MPGSGRLDDPDDRAEVARERRERLGDRLLVADVGEDVAPDRQAAAGLGRHVQPGLVHQAEQAERPQRDRLAAGVRAGDDEGRVAVAEPDVDGHDPAGQPGCRADSRIASVRSAVAARLALISAASEALAIQKSKRASASSVSRRGAALAAIERRQLVEDAGDLLGLGDLRLAPGVAELDRDERLDEQGLAAARRVVDDALDPRPGLGLDRHHVAAVAERDDRLLEGAPELRADERIQPAPQPVVGDTDGRPQATETRRRGVEQLPDRVEAARQRRADRGQRVELAPEVAQERAGARRRAASRGAPSRRASSRSRGTGRGRGGRRAPRVRQPARCRAPRRSRRPGGPRRASAPGRSRRGRARR